MSVTARPIDALNWAQQFIKNMPLYRVQIEVLNDAAREMWRAAPWRWTLGNLTPVTIINAQQDYTVTLPADFEMGIEANLIYPDKTSKNLEVVPFLPLNGIKYGMPSEVAITGSGVSGQYRFNPIPNGYSTNNPAPEFNGMYKKSYTVLDETSIYTSGSLVFPDIYNDVFKAGVLYYAFVYSNDQRAGTTQIQGDKSVSNGQRGNFEAKLEDMRQMEPLPLKDVRTSEDPKIKKG